MLIDHESLRLRSLLRMSSGLLPCLLLSALALALAAKTQQTKPKSDPEDNKGNTPFFLQDDT